MGIISTFNVVLSEIGSPSDQISSGARMISEFSVSLAQGATEQAGAAEKFLKLSQNRQTKIQTMQIRQID